MKASVERALLLLDRRSFTGVADYRSSRSWNRQWVNPGRNPYGDGICPLLFKDGVTDYWTEDDEGVIRHYLFTVEKEGEVTVEELEITEDDF